MRSEIRSTDIHIDLKATNSAPKELAAFLYSLPEEFTI